VKIFLPVVRMDEAHPHLRAIRFAVPTSGNH
jgi:hypothetical protein